MVALRVRAQARAEIAEAFEWYLARSQAASADFLAELDAAMNKIAEAPGIEHLDSRVASQFAVGFTNIWKQEGDTWRLYWRHANVIAPR